MYFGRRRAAGCGTCLASSPSAIRLNASRPLIQAHFLSSAQRAHGNLSSLFPNRTGRGEAHCTQHISHLIVVEV